MDFRPHDRQALEQASSVIGKIPPDQLHRPTPCTGWDLGDLLRHMVAQNQRFAAVARGEDPDAACPLDGGDLGSDPAAAFRASADEVGSGFAAADLEQPVSLPELPGPLPAGVMVGFHFTDFLVHGWDVAKAAGLPYEPPPALSAAALGLASRIPDQARAPGGPFGPAAATPAGSGDLARLLAATGRSPAWAPPGTAGRS